MWVEAEDLLVAPERWNLLDVRTPMEYERGHIPGARNVPLFSDEERSQVGLCYKTEGQTSAILLGLELVGPKMRVLAESMVGGVTDERPTLLYCWRGGMRSESMSWLLSRFGVPVYRLRGGYKAFRRAVLAEIGRPRCVLLLGGKTGSGKTELLQSLQEAGEAVLDLERLAHHKGSSFGTLGESEQPSQQQFENELGVVLAGCGHSSVLWLENESRCIGHVTVPALLWEQMRSAIVIELQVPKENRIERLVRIYGHYDKLLLQDAIFRIENRLGPQHAKAALLCLEQENAHGCCEILLEHYYDKMYERSRNKSAKECVVEVGWDGVDPDNGKSALLGCKIRLAAEVSNQSAMALVPSKP